MNEATNYLSEVSLFGASAPALLIILTVNLILTLVHSFQELRGRLWRYFGAIAGIHISDKVGFLLFFVGLTVTLGTLGITGITGQFFFLFSTPTFSIFALGFIIGGRLSDTLYSHVRLHRQGFRPNPGLTTTRYYIAEAIILIVVFSPGLMDEYILGIFGFGAGWLLFFVVLPTIRFLRIIIKPWQREKWVAGEKMPAWAKK